MTQFYTQTEWGGGWEMWYGCWGLYWGAGLGGSLDWCGLWMQVGDDTQSYWPNLITKKACSVGFCSISSQHWVHLCLTLTWSCRVICLPVARQTWSMCSPWTSRIQVAGIPWVATQMRYKVGFEGWLLPLGVVGYTFYSICPILSILLFFFELPKMSVTCKKSKHY